MRRLNGKRVHRDVEQNEFLTPRLAPRGDYTAEIVCAYGVSVDIQHPQLGVAEQFLAISASPIVI
jgi:hypothetical protein